ncbi:hypothetical protein [Streptomyces sp. NPDC050428]|uniref:hypothetical protein n=1 Tax=Streptomyces sp. NPDC050428 TaxID=3155757 RepID=UPI0034215B61
MTPAKTLPRNRTAMRRAAVIGSLCALVAAWLLLVNVRGELAEERAFRAAVSCDSGDDCLRTTAARVDRTERVEGKKTASYFLYVTEADGTSSSPRLWGDAPEPPTAWAGTRVEVTYWRGQIRYVDFDSDTGVDTGSDTGSGSGRHYTTADPRGDHKPFAAFGLALGSFSLGFLWIWYWWARHSQVSAKAAPWQLGVPLVGSLFLTMFGAGAPLVTDEFGAALQLFALGALVTLVASLSAAVILARRQGGDDTITMTPTPPTEDHVFAARIVGEVPYATLGPSFLVAGPTSLASSPDHTGATFRRPIPTTLTAVRVRPPYWRDPDHLDYGSKAVVLECEDGGVPVLVVADKKNMPWLLATLQRTP